MRHKDAEGYVTHSLLPILHTDAHKHGVHGQLSASAYPEVHHMTALQRWPYLIWKCNLMWQSPTSHSIHIGQAGPASGGGKLPKPWLLHPCIAMQCVSHHSGWRLHCLLLGSQLKLLNLAVL